MEISKKKWTMPLIETEKFTPNNYCSVCTFPDTVIHGWMFREDETTIVSGYSTPFVVTGNSDTTKTGYSVIGPNDWTGTITGLFGKEIIGSSSATSSSDTTYSYKGEKISATVGGFTWYLYDSDSSGTVNTGDKVTATYTYGGITYSVIVTLKADNPSVKEYRIKDAVKNYS